MSFARDLTIRALRVPAPWVPGWFPLVVEPVHRRVGPSEGDVVLPAGGQLMALDPREYTQRRFIYGCWEFGELRVLRRVLRAGDVMVDVGAHVGFMTLAAARAVGERGEVHAFEPIPSNFARLERNVELNGLRNVRLHRSAVGAAGGTVRLGLTNIGVASGTTGGYTVGGEHGQVETPMVALDDYLPEQLADRRVRLLKIDAEGHEPAVLDGLASTLDRLPPDALMVEVNGEMLSEGGSGLLDRLRAAGYAVHRIGPRGNLGPLPDAVRIAKAERRRHAAGEHAGALRGGLLERDAFFNALAIRPGSGVA